jgi:hypothetical protein
VLVVLVQAHLLRAVAAVEFGHDLLVGCLSAAEFERERVYFAYSRCQSAISISWRGVCTLAPLLQRALGGMAGLETLGVLLRRTAMVVRLRWNGCHVAASTCFESKGDRRHFDCDMSDIARGVGGSSAGRRNFLIVIAILAPRLWRHARIPANICTSHLAP